MNRVCFVVPSLEAGGTERQLVYLVEGLARDHEVTVICTRNKGAFAGRAHRGGARIYTLDGQSGWDFTMRRKLRKLFRGHRPDIVHSLMFGFDYAVSRAARDTGVPVVVSGRRQLATWKKRRHVHLQKKANKLVDCVVANSHAVARFAAAQEQADPALFRVIPNGICADEFTSTTDENHLRTRFDVPFHTRPIGIIANYSPVKDHRLFLDIAGEVMRRRVEAHFLMVGNGRGRRAIEREIHSRSWSDRFTQISSTEEIADLLRLMDVLVLCSQCEGFPNVVMESMAAGTPVVAASVGGVPELIQHRETGLLVESRRPEEFADAIEWVLDHPDDSRAMAGRAGERLRTEFTVHTMVEAHRTLYRELLADSSFGGQVSGGRPRGRRRAPKHAKDQ